MKKILTSLILFSQLSASANSEKFLDDLIKVDPEFARELEAASSADRKEVHLRLLYQYERNLTELFKLGIYAKSRGHWLLDVKITRAWLVPTAVALAGIYAHMRHNQILKEASARVSRNLPLTSEQSSVVNMSARARYLTAFLSAGVIGVIGYFSSEVKRTNELKALDAVSEEDVIAKYEKLLCETNKQAIELGLPQFVNAQTGKTPECN